MQKNHKIIFRMCLSSMFIAMAYIFPFITGNIPEIGSMLSPMHIPVLLCGFICGWKYGLAVGLISPLLRSLTLTLPPFFPDAISMSLELATYGAISGLFYQLFAKIFKNELANIYVSLIIAMLLGRVVWGLSRWFFLLFGTSKFTIAIFLSRAFINAWPGIILQLVLIPIVMLTLISNSLLEKNN